MNLNEQLKKIDDYFANITEEQFKKDMSAIGIDELIKYIEEDEKTNKKEIYFINANQYIYNQEVNYNILPKEGTRCQMRLTKQKKQAQKMALAS